MAASISRRLFGVSTTVAGVTLMAAAVATISTWFPLIGRGELANGAPASATALLRMGLTAVVAGGAILALLYFFRHWPSAQLASDNVDPVEMGPALVLFGAYLAALPFLCVAAAAPAIRFAQAHPALGRDPIGQFALMVPIFETLLTVGLFVGAVAVVGLFLSKSAAFPKSFITLVGFQLGFVLIAFAAIDLGSAVTDPFAAAVPLIQEHQTAVRTVARNQTGLLVASAVWVAFLIMSPRTAALFVVQPETWVSPSRYTSIHMPSPSVVEEPREAAHAMSSDNAPRYVVRANYVAGILGGALEAVDLNGPEVLSAKLVPMTGHIQVYSSARVVRQIVRATRNRYFTPWPAYEVAASEGERLGGMKKISRAEWRIFDASGREIGSIDQGAVSTGKAMYRAHIGSTPVCTFAWSNVLMPQLVLDCSPSGERLLDGRFALACALALFVDVCPSA